MANKPKYDTPEFWAQQSQRLAERRPVLLAQAQQARQSGDHELADACQRQARNDARGAAIYQEWGEAGRPAK